MTSSLKVSVICTVLNEGEAITRLLDSLAAQTRPPDEVIMVDGGSTDATVDVLKTYQNRLPLRVLVEPGANISRGRNVAISTAAGPIIAATDAGVRLAPDWLAHLMAPFAAPNPPQAVAGFFTPDVQSAFEVAMGATVLPLVTDVNPRTFLPSSRSVAFTKSAWQKAGGYPEWIDFCEDLIFDFTLKDQIGSFVFAPQAVARFKPRTSLKSFFKQYYLYARGDGKADLWRKRHAIRYATYLLALPILLLLGALVSPWWWPAGAIIGGAGMFYTPYRRLPRLWGGLTAAEKLRAVLWVPVIRVTGDIAKMMGYPAGLRWRRQWLASRPELNWRNRRPLAD